MGILQLERAKEGHKFLNQGFNYFKMAVNPIEYRIYEGREYRQLMPKLIEDGFTPISTKDGLSLMLCALRTGISEHIERLVDNYIDTGDGFVPFEDRLIVVPSARQLRRANASTHLVWGKIPLIPDEVPDLGGITLSRHDLERDGVNFDLTKAQASNHSGWLARAHGDTDLLNEFVEAAYSYAKKKFGYDTTMSFYLPEKTETLLMRAAFISYLAWRFKPGDYGILTNPGRIVGIRNPLPARLESLVHV